MIRLEQEAHREDFEEWGSIMSYKIFLLEKELGFLITPDMNGLALMERLNMLDRFWAEQKESTPDTPKTPKGKSKGKGLMK